MITLQDLSEYLHQLLFVPGLVDYCPNGLQVEGRGEIKKIALAVTASVNTIEAAKQLGADVLIVHHGVFWNKESYNICGIKRKKLSILLKNEISLFAYHLPLDSHRELGNNWKAAKDLGWTNLQPFSDIGVKGEFPEISIMAFQKTLESYYLHPATIALGGKCQVKSAALVSGGAYRLLSDAARAKVDCFITGNFDEPAWDAAHEENINFFALGHHATERVGIIGLQQDLERKFDLPCMFIDSPNPF